jgi:hypothetical protein
VVSDVNPSRRSELAATIERMLKDRLGLQIATDVVGPGDLDGWTEAGTSPKLKRFRDERA